MLQCGMASNGTTVQIRIDSARLEPDSITPDQLRPPPVALAALPERRLISAILEHAVADFQRFALATDVRSRRLFLETQAWFLSDADASPFTFVSICQALGLEPTWVRGGLKRWLERARYTHLGRVAGRHA